MNSSQLTRYPLQVACAKSLPVQPAARCQDRVPKQVSKASDEENWKFPIPNSTFFHTSFFHIFSLDTFCLLGLGYFDLTLHFSNKVSPKQTCPTLFPYAMLCRFWCTCYSFRNIIPYLILLSIGVLVNVLGIILEDSASLICSDETQKKATERQVNPIQ